MANEKDFQEEHVFTYRGPIYKRGQANPQAPLSPETARLVALESWGKGGRIRSTDHFRTRSSERNFSTLDVQEVIRHGRPECKAEFCREFNNYKYRFQGMVDGLELRVAFALDATQDYSASPLVILITGVWRNKTGARKK